MIVYESIGKYIQSCSTIKAKIAAIDAIIEKLLITAADAAGTANFQEYMMNDGQTIVKTTYTSASSIMAAIRDFEDLRTLYVNKTQPRMIRLVDSKNFSKRYGRR